VVSFGSVVVISHTGQDRHGRPRQEANLHETRNPWHESTFIMHRQRQAGRQTASKSREGGREMERHITSGSRTNACLEKTRKTRKE